MPQPITNKTIEQMADEEYPYYLEEFPDANVEPNNQYVRQHNIDVTCKRAAFKEGFNAAREHPELLRDLFEEFAEWIHKEGWQEYSGYDEWIDIDTKKVVETKELFDLWIESRKK